MKNIQTGILKILALTGFVLSCSATLAQSPLLLAKADSLFGKKQYTQSFEIYQQLYSQHQYSPAMLLKMAYIQEGLGHASMSLYYLNLYYLASGDEQALHKMDEYATKNKLEGFTYSSSTPWLFTFKKYQQQISWALVSLIAFFVAYQFYLARKSSRVIAPAVFALLLCVLLAVQINISPTPQEAIVVTTNTYLMTGPSAGANVVTQIQEGNKLKVLGKKDVWLKVEWLDQIVFVKENQVLPLTL